MYVKEAAKKVILFVGLIKDRKSLTVKIKYKKIA